MKALFIELTNSQEITDALFDSYCDMAQAFFESKRPWMRTRSSDSSQTVSGSLTLNQTFPMPTNFLRWYDPKRSFQLIAQLGPNSYDVQPLLEIPLAAKYTSQFDSNKFFVDYNASVFGITGSLTKTYTIFLFYIMIMPLVSSNDGEGNYTVTWWPPVQFHSFIPLTAAAFWQLGADYDVLSNPKGNQHAAMAGSIFEAAATWDDDLAHNAQYGLNTFGAGSEFRDHSLGPDWARGGDVGPGY